MVGRQPCPFLFAERSGCGFVVFRGFRRPYLCGMELKGLSPIQDYNGLLAHIEAPVERLRRHPLFALLQQPAHIPLFMQHHVFAVWDYMSLLKTLQQMLTGVEIPWLPTLAGGPLRRFINEMVLAEESASIGGECQSQFEAYLQAMEKMGADTAAIQAFIAGLRKGEAISVALQEAQAPKAAADFTEYTFAVIGTGLPHVIGAVFLLARRRLLPDIYTSLKDAAGSHNPWQDNMQALLPYDGEAAAQEKNLLTLLCGTDSSKWTTAALATHTALRQREALWNGIYARLNAAKSRGLSSGRV